MCRVVGSGGGAYSISSLLIKFIQIGRKPIMYRKENNIDIIHIAYNKKDICRTSL